MKRFALTLLILIAACAEDSPAEPVRFGLIADVQYADIDTLNTRRYRSSLAKLEAAVGAMNDHDLAFVVQLGDIVDGRDTLEGTRTDLTAVLQRFDALEAPLFHVIGNHCLSLPREELLERLRVERTSYSSTHGDWRFVIVDTMAWGLQGVPSDHPMALAARSWLDANPDAPNAQTWNGGLGEEQRAWLDRELSEADASGQRAVVFAHHPVLTDAADPALVAWDAEEVLAVLDAHPSVFAWINGHHHAGGYAQRRGVHHWTMKAMLDAPEESNAYAIVVAWPDRLEVTGVGDVVSRVLAASE